MDAELWNLLHDGGVEQLTGRVPGDVIVRASLSWLTAEFQPASELLTVVLHGCVGIEYREFGQRGWRTGIGQLQGLPIELLSAVKSGDAIEVTASQGLLRLRYADAELRLDDGRLLSIAELAAAADSAVSNKEGGNKEGGHCCF